MGSDRLRLLADDKSRHCLWVNKTTTKTPFMSQTVWVQIG